MASTDASMALPSPSDDIQRFIETENFSLLEKPLVFGKNTAVNSYMCCLGSIGCLASVGVSAIFCPLGTCCPYAMYKHYGLKLNQDSVQASTATNDCCCHVATSLKTVPLDKIQDVELNKNCLQTCFGVQQLNIQTAGQSGQVGAEVMATYLQNPAQVREAIQLAVKLHREAATSAPGQATMTRAGGSAAAAGATTMLQRLQNLEGLVKRGVLNPAEASQLRVAVLAADRDPLGRLTEAAELLDRRLISEQEFLQLKGSLLAQIAGAAGGGGGGSSGRPAGGVAANAGWV